MTAAIIAIPIAVLGIYGAYREHYKINAILAVFSLLGLLMTFFSNQNASIIVTDLITTSLLIYYVFLIRKYEQYSNGANNPELGKVQPNESSGIVMNAYKP